MRCWWKGSSSLVNYITENYVEISLHKISKTRSKNRSSLCITLKEFVLKKTELIWWSDEKKIKFRHNLGELNFGSYWIWIISILNSFVEMLITWFCFVHSQIRLKWRLTVSLCVSKGSFSSPQIDSIPLLIKQLSLS